MIDELFLPLLREMTLKDIKARYKHAFLGFFWIILTPLLQMFVIATLFSFFVKSPIKDYYVFLLAGLLFWNFFSMSLTKASSSIVDNRSLIQKAKFPRLAIPVSIVLANFFHLLISTLLLTIWVFIFGKINLVSILLIFFGLLWILTLTLALSLVVSAYNVRFRDISYFLQVSLQVLFYATPILYPISLIPSRYHFLFAVNPIAQISVVIQSAFVATQITDIFVIILNIFITLAALLIGYFAFQRQSRTFDDWV